MKRRVVVRTPPEDLSCLEDGEDIAALQITCDPLFCVSRLFASLVCDMFPKYPSFNHSTRASEASCSARQQTG